MARVTVEDCVDKVPNRFELVMLAAHRAREIQAGELPTVDRDNDKNPVVALREIAAGNTDPFYQAKLQTARFYFAKLFPETATLMRTARSGAAALMDTDAVFA